MNETKTCRRCGQTKPVTEFATRKAAADGYHLYCRTCDSDIQRAHRQRIKKSGRTRQFKLFALASDIDRLPKLYPTPEVLMFVTREQLEEIEAKYERIVRHAAW